MLLDTDVLIWYMRGDGNARDLVEGLPNITLSAVTQPGKSGTKKVGETSFFEFFDHFVQDFPGK
uniref:PIN domain-containing protein n=1 Tax=Candidatus Kentrum sp. FM TaxID=2126340 RepID=A0A450TLB6_9GAMM|nr:MAG: hypothetical protein BECKFM1743A_GA0114220_104607 [Candidatus Kentron sp. FM]VFJ68438.1 MAG: hypothetical protein BECKFM1743C_GA0114222_104857 [Candidatus Kentron sp. FM]VFK16862.1 MAG: hypothetical protein BECKFM1743B_GA0114221_104477 [Candidatus Kentron sp. FM]